MQKYLTLAALAVAFAVGGAWMLTRPSDTGLQGDLLPGAASAQEAEAETDAAEAETEAGTEAAAAEEPVIDTATVIEMAQGSETAPVTIIEYASYTCPHCAAFHAAQYQQLKPYIADGRVRFIFREVYFDRFGLWASMIARCSGDSMRFFGITDLLYEGQREWIGEGEPGLIADNLRTLALTAGLAPETVDACMQDNGKAETLVAWFQENATRDAIESTPTLLINGEKYGNMPFAEIAALIDPIVEASDWVAPE